MDNKEILNVVINYFNLFNVQELPFEDVLEYLTNQMEIKNDEIPTIKTIFKERDGKVFIKELLVNNDDNQIMSTDDKLEDISNENISLSLSEGEKLNQLYYCSKKVTFPMKDVIEFIYGLFDKDTQEPILFETIYKELLNHFGVKQFNRNNLSILLKSDKNVLFNNVLELYKKTNVISDTNDEEKFLINFACGEDSFLRLLLKKNSLNDLFNFFDNPKVNSLNGMNISFENDNIVFSHSNKTIYLNKNNIKTIVEILEIMMNKCCSLEGLNEILDNFMLEKKTIAKNKSILNNFENLISKINFSNNNIKIKNVFSKDLSDYLESKNIVYVSELICISDEDVISLSSNQDFINKLMYLSIDIKNKLYNDFRLHLQNLRKSGKVDGKWERDVDVLSKRADGLTFTKISEIYGLTKQGIQSIENKFLTNFAKFLRQEHYLLNHIRMFLKVDSVIDNDDFNNIYKENGKCMKYLIQKSSIESLRYIDELDKFYFVNEFDWYSHIIEYSKQMPEQIEEGKVDDYVSKEHEFLNMKLVPISFEECKIILLQDYKIAGTMYCNTRMTLRTNFANIIDKYYKEPINIHDANFLEDFNKNYSKVYGDTKERTIRSMEAVLADIVVLIDRGKYIIPTGKLMSKELADKIYEYIINDEKEIFDFNYLFSKFEKELIDERIDNKYMLQGAFKQWYGNDENLYYKKDTISTNPEMTSFNDLIYKYIENAGGVVTKQELEREFKGIPFYQINSVIAQEGILSFKTKYIHPNNISISESNKDYLFKIIENYVKDGEIHHIKELYSFIKLDNEELLKTMFINNEYGFYSVMEYLYNDKFSFQRPFIARHDIKIAYQTERIIEYLHSYDEIEISQLLQYCYSNGLRLNCVIKFVDGLEDYVFKDDEKIINIEKTNLNKYNVQEVEKVIKMLLNNNDFVTSNDVRKYYHLFSNEVKWTDWLTYCAVNLFANDIMAIPSDNIFKNAIPIYLKKDLEIYDVDDLKKYLKEKLSLGDTEFYYYLAEKGLA